MNKYYALLLCILTPLCAAAQTDWKAITRHDKQAAKAELTQRLTRYAALETQSSKGKTAFAKSLAKELKRIGAQNVKTDKNGLVTAEIAASSTSSFPSVALVAYFGAPAVPSALNVKPQVHTKYKGGDIAVSKDKNLYIREQENTQLLEARGHDLVTASGGTLLGADGKAGISVILTLADILLGHPSIAHGPVKLAFLPAYGPENATYAPAVKALSADYAYVLDGSNLGEITDENFSGKSFSAVFNGKRNTDTGNAMYSDFSDNLLMASDFHALLPRHRRPETTALRRGFIWVNALETQGNQTTVRGEIRAFDDAEMAELTAAVEQAFRTVQSLNPKRAGAELSFQEQFQNAKNALPASLLSATEKALRAEDMQPKFVFKRGANTAGALTASGLPALGIFSGAFHPGSETEYSDADVMEASLRTLLTALSTRSE